MITFLLWATIAALVPAVLGLLLAVMWRGDVDTSEEISEFSFKCWVIAATCICLAMLLTPPGAS